MRHRFGEENPIEDQEGEVCASQYQLVLDDEPFRVDDIPDDGKHHQMKVNPSLKNNLIRRTFQRTNFIKFKNNLYVRRGTSVLLFWMKLLSGPLLALPFFCGALSELGSSVNIDRCAGITVWIACYWVLQPVPLPVTSLLPLILFPLLGITSGKSLAYNDTSILFIGSFIMTTAIEKWNIHKRIALFVMSLIGLKPRILFFAVTCLVGIITMWISNAATTAMFLPMAKAVISSIRTRNEENPNKEDREREEVKIKKFSKALFLIIPMTSVIMGSTTLIGTPTNLVIGQVLHSHFKNLANESDNPVSFINWFIYSFPQMFVLLIATFLYFLIFLVRTINVDQHESTELENSLGKNLLDTNERVLSSTSIDSEYYINQSKEGQPTNVENERLLGEDIDQHMSRLQRWKAKIFKWRTPTGRIMEWKEAQSRIPWDILILLGGGFSLAQAFNDCGFSEFIVNVLVVKLDLATRVAPYTLMFFIVFTICMLTELTGNLSLAVLTMPFLAALGPKLGQNPVFFMAPALLSCSMAFMTPIGTGPNLLAFSSGQFTILDGLLHGGVINALAIVVIVLGSMTMFPAINVHPNIVPDWGRNFNTTMI